MDSCLLNVTIWEFLRVIYMNKIFFNVTLCLVITMVCAVKDTYPAAKIYLKNFACEINVIAVFENVISKELASFITKKEKQELMKLKESYCKSILEFN